MPSPEGAEGKERNVAAVIVAFNRPHFLQLCIHGILEQNFVVDHIYIIDNSSNEESKEIVNEKFKSNKKVEYVRSSPDEGASGGYARGIKMAYDDGYEWVWLFDDDLIPRPDALRKMLDYGHISSCIMPAREAMNGELLSETRPFLDFASGKMIFLNGDNNEDFYFTNTGVFGGMLVKGSLAQKAGLPDRRFFMYFDDAWFGFQLSLYTNPIYLKHTFVKDQDRKSSDDRKGVRNSLVGWRMYYITRNRFLLKNLLKEKGFLRGVDSFIYITGAVIKNLSKSVITFDQRTSYWIIRGLIDGLREKYGKTVKPI